MLGLGFFGYKKTLIVAKDSFDRDDSTTTLGTSDTGQTWSALSGTWGIASNEAYSVSNANGDLAAMFPGTADGAFQCTMRGTLNSGTNNSLPHLLFRLQDANNFLAARIHPSGGLQFLKWDGGSATVLASASQSMADNTDFTIRAVCKGNVVRVFVNGVLKVTHTLSGNDTKYADYTGVGVRLAKVGSPTVDARWDDLVVEGVPT